MSRRLAYSLGNIVGRVREFMNRTRDLALIVLGLIASLIVQFLFSLATQRWNIGWQGILIIAVAAMLVITIMVSGMISLYRGIGTIDQEAETEKKRESNERDRKLIQEITQSLQDAIEKAVQKQTEAIIKAMREPLDGHE